MKKANETNENQSQETKTVRTMPGNSSSSEQENKNDCSQRKSNNKGVQVQDYNSVKV